jgi:hypothetical protein
MPSSAAEGRRFRRSRAILFEELDFVGKYFRMLFG